MVMSLIVRSKVLVSCVSSSSVCTLAAAAALWPRPDWYTALLQQTGTPGVSFSSIDRRHSHPFIASSIVEHRALSTRIRRHETVGRGVASSTSQGDETCPSNQVSELHREMRQVFGSNLQHSIDRVTLEQEIDTESVNGDDDGPVARVGCSESHQGAAAMGERRHHDGLISSSRSTNQHTNQLTHTDGQGKARMVNVSEKEFSSRSATASARVLLGRETYELVAQNQIAKGDVLTVSKVAGIMGAKHTSTLIPLCHPILLSDVDVSLRLDSTENAVEVVATASTVGPTGVEMEALTAASVAALTVYDMCKASSKGIMITDVRLEEKKGGKSGHWVR